jgi:mycothiol synthase
MFPFGGELGRVATTPAHQSNGLGSAVSAAATRRLIGAAYESVRVGTQDHCLPAIKVYLRLGYVPYLYAASMAERWQRICARLDWPFTPEECVAPAHPPVSDERALARSLVAGLLGSVE